MSDAYFTEEEAEVVLERAAKRAEARGALSTDDLIRQGSKLGIDEADVRAAVDELRAGMTAEAVRREYVLAKKASLLESVGFAVLLSALTAMPNIIMNGLRIDGLLLMPCFLPWILVAFELSEYIQAPTTPSDEVLLTMEWKKRMGWRRFSGKGRSGKK